MRTHQYSRGGCHDVLWHLQGDEAEEDDAFILCCYEALGSRGPNGLRLGFPLSSAAKADLLEPLQPHRQNSRDDYQAPVGYRVRYEGRWTPAVLAALGGSTFQQLVGYWGMVRGIDEAFG